MGSLEILKSVAMVLGLCATCCGAQPGSARSEGTAQERSGIVYGADDRTEYFMVASADARARIEGSVVSLVPRSALSLSLGTVAFDAPTWGEVANLCPGEAFAEQPAAAFCSGVLVDWDLVLTAGHCTRLFALKDFVVVFGYYYDRPGHLAAVPTDVATPVSIAREALDPEGTVPRLDYAWLRLERPVTGPRRPAPLRLAPSLGPGDSIISIGAGGGMPLKLDMGGRVRDARPDVLDYFSANTDTTAGSSGGGAFDPELALTGIFSRGDPDLVETADGCNATVHVPDAATEANEQFSYAFRAVEALCQALPSASSLCRSDCGDPCEALPLPAESSGCAVRPLGCGSRQALLNTHIALLLGLLLFSTWSRRTARSDRVRSDYRTS